MDRIVEESLKGEAPLASRAFDPGKDFAREVHGCPLAAIRQGEYACDGSGRTIQDGGALGFGLRCGSGFATPSYRLELFVFHLVTCGLGFCPWRCS